MPTIDLTDDEHAGRHGGDQARHSMTRALI
jgi:hypothetical protein